jgi:membrane protease YdiL (CAAX protease family)
LVFVTGFGEELFFRGYAQARLNVAFGKPFQVAGVNIGWGLPVASVLFGISHAIFSGGTVGWGIATFGHGMVLGYVREKTGTIFACSLLHGMPYLVWVLYEHLTGTAFLPT